jgi:hypothetical protein
MSRATAHPLRLGAGAVASAAATVLVVSVLVGRASDRRAACADSLAPAYVPPDALRALVSGRHVPRLLIVNPASGPGAEPRAGLRDAVIAAQAAGARVLGYVPTAWGARPGSEVEADAERYRAWYGIDGVFLDEAAADPASLPYYAALRRALRGRFLVLNPGAVPAREYFDAADVVVTFEGPAAAYGDSQGPAWVRRIAPGRVAHLIYDASRAQALAALGNPSAGYVYATSGTLPDPWRTLPAYLAEEVAAGGCG